MNAEDWPRIREIFENAVERPPPLRRAFLQQACGEDSELRSTVEDLLRSEGSFDSLVGAIEFGPASAEAQAAGPSEGTRVGPYRLLGLIARGGMGSVYEAESDHPRRKVALKMLRPGLGGPEALRRFRHECDILAKLQHQGIARIHEAGSLTPEGVPDPVEIPWFAMEYVASARTVVEYVRQEQLPLTARLELFLEICEAVSHGHLHGVIHRDLKPANLLVDREGRPKVIDFGIARVADDDPDLTGMLTGTGAVMGTAQYMSPEQFSGDPGAVDLRTDVYALGVVLFEMLCDRLPYTLERSTLFEIATIVRSEPPARPRDLVPDLPREVEWVLLHALQKEPDRRYGSVTELAADVRRFLHHEPLQAGPPGAAYQLRKFVRRHRAGVVSSALLMLLLVGGLIGTLFGLLEADRRRVEAERQASRLQAVNNFLTELFRSANPSGAAGRDVKVAEILDRAVESLEANLDQEADIELSLREAIFAGYYGLGLPAESVHELTRILSLLDEIRPDDEESKLDYLRQRVRLHMETGELRQAEASALKLLEELASRFGAEEPRAVLARIDLGTAVYLQGRAGDALVHFEQALETALADQAPDSDLVLRIRLKLSDALGQSNRLDEAVAQVQMVIDVLEARGVSDGVFYVTAHQVLGDRLLSDPDRLESSRHHLDLAYTAAAELWGGQHPTTVRILHHRALVDLIQARAQTAEEKFRRVLASYEQIGGLRIEAVDASLSLAQALLMQGRLAEAEPILITQLELQRELFSRDEPRCLHTEGLLAALYQQQGENERARDLQADLLDRLPDVAGSSVGALLQLIVDTNSKMEEAGRADLAAELDERVADRAGLIFGEGCPLEIQALSGAILCRLALDEPERALGHVGRFLQSSSRAPDSGLPQQVKEAMQAAGQSLLDELELEPGLYDRLVQLLDRLE